MSGAPRVRHLERHWLPRALRVRAITLGRRVLWAGEVVPALVPHELAHVAQYRRRGALRFLARYLAEYAAGRLRGMRHRQAYLAISFEREAREAERADQLAPSPSRS